MSAYVRFNLYRIPIDKECTQANAEFWQGGLIFPEVENLIRWYFINKWNKNFVIRVRLLGGSYPEMDIKNKKDFEKLIEKWGDL